MADYPKLPKLPPGKSSPAGPAKHPGGGKTTTIPAGK